VCPTPPLNGVQYPPAPCALPANVGSAHVKGAEIETEIHPLTGWEIDASGSWLDFGYTEITNPNTGITRDMVTPYTPKWKWSVGTQYEAQLGDFGSITPRVDVSHNAAQFSNAINSTDWNRIDAYTIMNASLTWRSKEAVWQGALNVTNVSDKLYYLTLFDTHTSSGYLNGQPAMPRQWSVTVKRNF
jgi:iron complex outermembrane receptor protein